MAARAPWLVACRALIIAVLRNGFSLLSVSSAVQNLVLGLVIIGAVLLDVTRERMETGARVWLQVKQEKTASAIFFCFNIQGDAVPLDTFRFEKKPKRYPLVRPSDENAPPQGGCPKGAEEGALGVPGRPEAGKSGAPPTFLGIFIYAARKACCPVLLAEGKIGRK